MRIWLAGGVESSGVRAVSERKGGAHKIERKSIKIDSETHSELVTYCQSKKLKMRDVIAMFVEYGVQTDLYEEDWKEQAVRALNVTNVLADLGASCHRRAKGEDKSGSKVWSCVTYNENGPVKVRVLGNTEELMTGKCKACGLDRDVRAGLAQRDNKIMELETKIQMRAKTSRKVPVCNKGAILTQEGTAFRLCPKSSVPVSVKTYCKVLSSGLPCALYAEVELTEGPL